MLCGKEKLPQGSEETSKEAVVKSSDKKFNSNRGNEYILEAGLTAFAAGFLVGMRKKSQG